MLEDGLVLPGLPFGWRGVRLGEAVFSTAMVGYQEAISDPSYAGQVLALTVPHVGNYGVNPEDVESRRLHLAGFVVTSVGRPAEVKATDLDRMVVRGSQPRPRPR